MAKDAKKLDIKDVLYNIDIKNYEWFDGLTPEEQDLFNPFIVMQYLSGGRSGDNLELTNYTINTNFSTKSKNKAMFWRTCCIVGTGKSQYHPFVKPPKGGKRNTTSYVRLISEYTNETVDEQEAKMFLLKNSKLYNVEFWVMIADSMDWTKDEVSKLETELKPFFNSN